MKTSGHLILYISENDDLELWKILTQISPEERTVFVKNALKKAILQNSSKSHEGIKSNIHNTERIIEPLAEVAAADRQEVDHDQLQFDELFLSSAITDKSSIPGLDFLLNNVIGEEDDENVIEFIKNRIVE